MTQQPTQNNNQQRSWPELTGAQPYIMNMDDAQRAAHAMQMEAIARKTLAEAKQEEQKCIRTRLQIGWMYLWRFAIVFVVGGIAGFALSRLT